VCEPSGIDGRGTNECDLDSPATAPKIDKKLKETIDTANGGL